MVGREVLGIYLGQDSLHYACFSLKFGRWTPKKPATGLDPHGVWSPGGLRGLKGFLNRLRPRRRRFYLALPRNHFFVRGQELPPMPMDEAVDVTVASLPVACHLPLDEIFRDVHLVQHQGKPHALVFYAPVKVVERYLDVFEESGHGSGAVVVVPLSYALGNWLKVNGAPMPCAVTIHWEDGIELALFNPRGMLVSEFLSDGASHRVDGESLRRLAASRLGDVEPAAFYEVGDPEGWNPDFIDMSQGKKRLGADNAGFCAAACVMTPWQKISVDANPPKVPLPNPGKFLVPLFVAVALVASGITWRVDRKARRLETEREHLAVQVEKIRRKTPSLEKELERTAKIRAMIGDLEVFMDERPNFFDVFNRIANEVPEGTWCPVVQYRREVLKMRCRAKEAMKVVEKMRSLPFADEVKLQGSVRRMADGVEQFNVYMRLKGRGKDQQKGS